METFANSEQNFFVQKGLFPAMVEPTMNVDSTELSKRGVCRIHQASKVVVFVRSVRPQQLMLMHLQNVT